MHTAARSASPVSAKPVANNRSVRYSIRPSPASGEVPKPSAKSATSDGASKPAVPTALRLRFKGSRPPPGEPGSAVQRPGISLPSLSGAQLSLSRVDEKDSLEHKYDSPEEQDDEGEPDESSAEENESSEDDDNADSDEQDAARTYPGRSSHLKTIKAVIKTAKSRRATRFFVHVVAVDWISFPSRISLREIENFYSLWAGSTKDKGTLASNNIMNIVQKSVMTKKGVLRTEKLNNERYWAFPDKSEFLKWCKPSLLPCFNSLSAGAASTRALPRGSSPAALVFADRSELQADFHRCAADVFSAVSRASKCNRPLLAEGLLRVFREDEDRRDAQEGTEMDACIRLSGVVLPQDQLSEARTLVEAGRFHFSSPLAPLDSVRVHVRDDEAGRPVYEGAVVIGVERRQSLTRRGLFTETLSLDARDEWCYMLWWESIGKLGREWCLGSGVHKSVRRDTPGGPEGGSASIFDQGLSVLDAGLRRMAERERKAEEEAKRKAEEEAKRKAEEEAKRKAEEEAKRKAEEEAKRKAEEEAKRKAELLRQYEAAHHEYQSKKRKAMEAGLDVSAAEGKSSMAQGERGL